MMFEATSIDSAPMTIQPGTVEPTFLKAAFEQARDDSYAPRELAGPQLPALTAILADIFDRLKAVDPAVTQEYLFQPDYTSWVVKNHLGTMSNDDRFRLNKIASRKTEKLRELGDMAFRSGIAVPSLRFDTAPFRPQGDERGKDNAAQSCFGACFRMIYEAATGERVSERSLYSTLYAVHNNDIVDDRAYLNVFGTPAFNQRYQLQTRVLTMTGASLNAIAKMTQKLREQRPGLRVYGIASLDSESSVYAKTIWHANVLQEISDQSVIVHDPRASEPEADREIPRLSFERRWACALNRVHLILVNNAPERLGNLNR